MHRTLAIVMLSCSLLAAIPAFAANLSAPSPALNAIGVSRTPTLSWTWDGESATFDVYYGPQGTVSLPRVATRLSATAWTSYQLGYFADMAWYVVAHTAAGDVTGPTWTFQTHGTANVIFMECDTDQQCGKPFVFAASVRDSRGSVVADYQNTITWRTNFVASSYQANYSFTPTSSQFINGRCSATAAFSGPPGRVYLYTTISMRVERSYFTLTNPSDLPLPTLVAPALGSRGVERTPLLSWSWGDGTISATYDIYYGNSASMTLKVAKYGAQQYRMPIQEYNTLVVWYIVVHTAQGDVWGPKWGFYIHGAVNHFKLTVPSMPVYTGVPFDVTVTATDTYNNRVTDYRGSISLQAIRETQPVTDYMTGGIIAITNGQGTSQLTLHCPPGSVALTANRTYAYNYVTLTNPPDIPAPTPVSPDNHGSVNAQRPILKWAWDSTEPATFTVYRQTYARFSLPTVATTTVRELAIGTLEMTKSYYWWVRVNCARGEAWGGMWTFTPHLPAVSLRMSAITSPQRAGRPFPVTLTAHDADGNLVPDWQESLRVFRYYATSPVQVTPGTAELVNGTWTGDMTVEGPTEQLIVSAAGSGPVMQAKSGMFAVIVPSLPTAQDSAVTLEEDIPTPITLSAQDTDHDALTYTIIDGPHHGMLTGTAPDVLFTPDADWFGVDTITFTARDIDGVSNTATVTLTVHSVNDPPTTGDVSAVTYPGKAVTLKLPGADADGDVLAWSITRQPLHGTLTRVNSTGSFVYLPKPGYLGADDFTYDVSDGTATATGTAVLQVKPWSLLRVQYTGVTQYERNGGWYAIPSEGIQVSAGTQWVKFDGYLTGIDVPEASTVVKSAARLVVRTEQGAAVAGVACDLLTPTGWRGLTATNAQGVTLALVDGLAGVCTFRMRFAGDSREITQDIAADAVVRFTLP